MSRIPRAIAPQAPSIEDIPVPELNELDESAYCGTEGKDDALISFPLHRERSNNERNGEMPTVGVMILDCPVRLASSNERKDITSFEHNRRGILMCFSMQQHVGERTPLVHHKSCTEV